MQTAKLAAQEVINQLPEKASWDELMYELYVKKKIEDGLQAAKEGRVLSEAQVLQRLQQRKP